MQRKTDMRFETSNVRFITEQFTEAMQLANYKLDLWSSGF